MNYRSFLLAAALSAQAAPIRLLLVTGQADLPHHSWQASSAAIREIFAGDSRFELRSIEEPRALTNEALSGYRAVILCYNGPRLPAAAEAALERFIQEGGGFAAFHQASYGEWFGMELRNGRWTEGPTKGWEAFSRIAGMTWKPANVGHARRWPFEVQWVDKKHPIAAGEAGPWMANDELYHRIDLAPAARVIADAFSASELGGTGRREPVAWTLESGRGRVFYTPLGHDAMAWHQPGMRRMFLRGVEWAATGEVGDPPRIEPALRLLVVTGGHSYPAGFYTMLDSFEGIRWTHAATPEEAFARAPAGRYDAILLHDMRNTTTEQTRQRLREFVEAGGGVVSLHHAIVDYTDWPWWYEEVTGGKYFVTPSGGHEASAFREGVDYLAAAVKGKQNHPVLRGVGPLYLHDETYRNMWLSPRIDVLMETDAPGNDKPVVYIGPHPKARYVYIQPGHSAQTMANPGFRKLVRNALNWVARKEAIP